MSSFEQLPVVPSLRARWRQVALTFAVVMAGALAVSLALPPRYEATANVAVDVGGSDPMGGSAVFKPAGAVSTHVATQAEILRSEHVALAVVRSLGLQKQPEWRTRWEESTQGRGDFESWLAGRLLRRLAVRPGRDSNVIEVSFTSPDPEFSSAVVNAFVKSYIDATLDMQVGPARKFNTFFEERAKGLRQQLEQARARLSAYEKEHGLLVGDQPDVESARLAQLTTQLVTIQDQLTDAANRRRQAAATPGQMNEVRSDLQVAALSADLAREQSNLAKLKTQLGDQHPAVIEARQAIDDVRRRLSDATQRAAQGFAVPLKANEARLAEIKTAIERQRALVLQRQSRRDAATALVRDVENAQKAYDAVLQRASQTALESANTTQPHVSILKAATPPPQPAPLLAMNLAVGGLLGLLLGIASALFAESRDRRLRTIDDVTRYLQQPLLLSLPDGAARWRQAAARSRETRQRLVAVRPRLAAPR